MTSRAVISKIHCRLLANQKIIFVMLIMLTKLHKFGVFQIHVGDFVKVCPAEIHMPLLICCVRYMWEGPNGDKMFHCRWLRYKPAS